MLLEPARPLHKEYLASSVSRQVGATALNVNEILIVQRLDGDVETQSLLNN
jgi:hypothetical protein